MKHITLVILLIAAIQICGPAMAADLEITDVNGTVVALRNVIIDYTQYGMLYKPDKISTGIRAKQGEGVVTADWKTIDRVSISPKKTKNTQGIEKILLNAEITLTSGKKLSVILVEDSKDSNSEGLAGNTDLGWFKIHLEKVKEIKVLKSMSGK